MKNIKREPPPFIVQILVPKRVNSGDSVPVRTVMFPNDSKVSKRNKMYKTARSFIQDCYDIGTLTSTLVNLLSDSICPEFSESSLERRFGDLFNSYLDLHDNLNNNQLRDLMAKNIKNFYQGSSDCYFPNYIKSNGEKRSNMPLPFAIRNILLHRGDNKNSYSREQIQKAIDMLEDWLRVRI